MSDDTGLIEHAWFELPRRHCGYTVDDVARGLLVICREPQVETTPRLVTLAETYLDFLYHALGSNGRFRNRMSYAREWLDESESDDAHGRALWALGAAARSAPSAAMKRAAMRLFEAASRFDTPYSRANAYAILGAAKVHETNPHNDHALMLLERCTTRLPGSRGSQQWPWPEPRLTYDNARIPQSQLVAGILTHNVSMVEEGLALLEWLVDVETRGSHFSFAPTRGWRRDEPRPGFDQQPLEAAAMVDACVEAFWVTGDAAWTDLGMTAVRWFLGANDKNLSLYDESTGGCCDGLTANGVNENQGAESTLACIAALQQARRIDSMISDRLQGEQQVGFVNGGSANRAVGRPIGYIDSAVIKTVGAADKDDVIDITPPLPRQLGY
ncbi:MAG: glycosyltransferase [Proteobacteria bacterium]|nr:glycosyltransferase [Pseudomonadota bacterium]